MKKFVLLIVTLILAVSFAACKTGGTPKPESLSYITEKGSLIIGVGDSFEPICFKDENGTLTGYDIDMAKEVGKRMNIAVEFLPIDMETKVLLLYGKNVDCLWYGIALTDENKAAVTYTDPYLANKKAIVVKNKSDIVKKEDLKSKKVAVREGSSAEAALKKETDIFDNIGEKINYTDNNKIFSDLLEGKADAIITDEVTALYYSNLKLGEFTILDENFGEENFGVGFRDEATELREAVQKQLKAIKSDGTAATISEKWFGTDISK